MRRTYRTSLLVFALSPLLWAADVSAQSAGAFARIGFGARGVAMGNALAGDASGYASPYYNPALAPFIVRQSLDLSAAHLSLDRQLQFLQLATPLRPRAGLAAGLVHAGVGDIDGRDGSGYHTETYSINEYAFFLAFGVRMVRRATIGVGIQLFRSDLFDGLTPARSIGFDLGLNIEVTNQLHLGFVADDLLASYGWDTSVLPGGGGASTTDRFPVRLRLGGSYRLRTTNLLLTAEYESRFTFSEVQRRRVEVVGSTPRELFDAEQLTVHDSQLRLGAEFHPVRAFALRGGANQLLSGARPSAGFMVEQTLGALLARLEYAFMLEPYALGSMHLLTIRIFL